ncbi:hypothetical protein [Methylobacterium sp. SyP6R]|uniref:hypothetical protein n=1 Tax=Methylobacterium sp. SyP6R TaxID=2718876 RepID=UPI001F18E38E|nr:hypothetical protein [Methylobacterium sp. SyP6R]MCF4125050.1 hypothetical protein [Methylobacterium sp. SyP6R]
MFSAISAPLTLNHDGRTYPDFTVPMLREAGVPDDVVLVGVKARLTVAIDERAESLRRSVLSPGVGQALEYQEAQTQAAAALEGEASAATAGRYPMLAATVGIDIDPETGAPATDILGVARSVQAARDIWLAIGAAIRGTRLGAKAAVEAASSIEGAQAAYDAVVWPTLPD